MFYFYSWSCQEVTVISGTLKLLENGKLVACKLKLVNWNQDGIKNKINQRDLWLNDPYPDHRRTNFNLKKSAAKTGALWYLSEINCVDTAPQTRLRSSTGRDMRLCYRASGSLASPRCSTCCGRSGWCPRGGTARSERSGSESPGCRRFWYNAPIPLRSIWMNQREDFTDDIQQA